MKRDRFYSGSRLHAIHGRGKGIIVPYKNLQENSNENRYIRVIALIPRFLIDIVS
jgi:hypothetical protein